MVHRPADSRLLSNLLTHEKDYAKHFQALLTSSHASLSSFAAYAAASPPPASHTILAVAGTLAAADAALAEYAKAVDEWREGMKGLQELEDEVGNIMRDREILVTRLIKASKSTKSSNASTSLFSLGSPSSSSSLNLNHPPHSPGYSTRPLPTTTKLAAAQAELQACETHLAAKERQLEARRYHAIRDGLNLRCTVMAETGWKWTELGREALEVVEHQLGLSTAASTSSAAAQKEKEHDDGPEGVHKPTTSSTSINSNSNTTNSHSNTHSSSYPNPNPNPSQTHIPGSYPETPLSLADPEQSDYIHSAATSTTPIVANTGGGYKNEDADTDDSDADHQQHQLRIPAAHAIQSELDMPMPIMGSPRNSVVSPRNSVLGGAFSPRNSMVSPRSSVLLNGTTPTLGGNTSGNAASGAVSPRNSMVERERERAGSPRVRHSGSVVNVQSPLRYSGVEHENSNPNPNSNQDENLNATNGSSDRVTRGTDQLGRRDSESALPTSPSADAFSNPTALDLSGVGVVGRVVGVGAMGGVLGLGGSEGEGGGVRREEQEEESGSQPYPYAVAPASVFSTPSGPYPYPQSQTQQNQMQTQGDAGGQEGTSLPPPIPITQPSALNTSTSNPNTTIHASSRPSGPASTSTTSSSSNAGYGYGHGYAHAFDTNSSSTASNSPGTHDPNDLDVDDSTEPGVLMSGAKYRFVRAPGSVLDVVERGEGGVGVVEQDGGSREAKRERERQREKTPYPFVRAPGSVLGVVRVNDAGLVTPVGLSGSEGTATATPTAMTSTSALTQGQTRDQGETHTAVLTPMSMPTRDPDTNGHTNQHDYDYEHQPPYPTTALSGSRFVEVESPPPPPLPVLFSGGVGDILNPATAPIGGAAGDTASAPATATVTGMVTNVEARDRYESAPLTTSGVDEQQRGVVEGGQDEDENPPSSFKRHMLTRRITEEDLVVGGSGAVTVIGDATMVGVEAETGMATTTKTKERKKRRVKRVQPATSTPATTAATGGSALGAGAGADSDTSSITLQDEDRLVQAGVLSVVENPRYSRPVVVDGGAQGQSTGGGIGGVLGLLTMPAGGPPSGFGKSEAQNASVNPTPTPVTRSVNNGNAVVGVPVDSTVVVGTEAPTGLPPAVPLETASATALHHLGHEPEREHTESMLHSSQSPVVGGGTVAHEVVQPHRGRKDNQQNKRASASAGHGGVFGRLFGRGRAASDVGRAQGGGVEEDVFGAGGGVRQEDVVQPQQSQPQVGHPETVEDREFAEPQTPTKSPSKRMKEKEGSPTKGHHGGFLGGLKGFFGADLLTDEKHGSGGKGKESPKKGLAGDNPNSIPNGGGGGVVYENDPFHQPTNLTPGSPVLSNTTSPMNTSSGGNKVKKQQRSPGKGSSGGGGGLAALFGRHRTTPSGEDAIYHSTPAAFPSTMMSAPIVDPPAQPVSKYQVVENHLDPKRMAEERQRVQPPAKIRRIQLFDRQEQPYEHQHQHQHQQYGESSGMYDHGGGESSARVSDHPPNVNMVDVRAPSPVRIEDLDIRLLASAEAASTPTPAARKSKGWNTRTDSNIKKLRRDAGDSDDERYVPMRGGGSLREPEFKPFVMNTMGVEEGELKGLDGVRRTEVLVDADNEGYDAEGREERQIVTSTSHPVTQMDRYTSSSTGPVPVLGGTMAATKTSASGGQAPPSVPQADVSRIVSSTEPAAAPPSPVPEKRGRVISASGSGGGFGPFFSSGSGAGASSTPGRRLKKPRNVSATGGGVERQASEEEKIPVAGHILQTKRSSSVPPPPVSGVSGGGEVQPKPRGDVQRKGSLGYASDTAAAGGGGLGRKRSLSKPRRSTSLASAPAPPVPAVASGSQTSYGATVLAAGGDNPSGTLGQGGWQGKWGNSGGAAALSRNSSTMSAASAPAGPAVPVGRTKAQSNLGQGLGRRASLGAQPARSSSVDVTPVASPRTSRIDKRTSMPMPNVPGATSAAIPIYVPRAPPVRLASDNQQPSLLSIVEDVRRSNREAEERLRMARGKVGLGVAVPQAPSRVFRESLVGVGGMAEVPKAPGSVFSSGTSGPVWHQQSRDVRQSNQLSAGSPVNRRVSGSSRPVHSPLKSAMRNTSRTPSPLPVPASRTESPALSVNPTVYSSTMRGNAVHHNSPPVSTRPFPQQVIRQSGLAPPVGTSNIPGGYQTTTQRQKAESPVTKTKCTAIPQVTKKAVDDDDDGASISSYETAEFYSGDEGEGGEGGAPKRVRKVSLPKSKAPLANGNAQLQNIAAPTYVPKPTQPLPPSQALPNSSSTDANPAPPPKTFAATPPLTNEIVDTPHRKKSVRVSLQPTFSPTPPAIDYDGEPSYSAWTVAGAVPTPPKAKANPDSLAPLKPKKRGVNKDVWQDSSDEDEEYQKAKLMLSRAARQEQKTFALVRS